jgi:hypothetical protein
VPNRDHSLVDTVEQPDYVAADASRHRLELADKANALEIALDAADSSNAKDSLEKMLVHEMGGYCGRDEPALQ